MGNTEEKEEVGIDRVSICDATMSWEGEIWVEVQKGMSQFWL
jgi:hypothetical protein